MKSLLDEGFNERTLEELINICGKQFNSNPTIYFVLHNIYNKILDAFDNQAIPIELYNKFESLIPYIKNVLLDKDLNSLNNLIIAFNKLHPAYYDTNTE